MLKWLRIEDGAVRTWRVARMKHTTCIVGGLCDALRLHSLLSGRSTSKGLRTLLRMRSSRFFHSVACCKNENGLGDLNISCESDAFYSKAELFPYVLGFVNHVSTNTGQDLARDLPCALARACKSRAFYHLAAEPACHST